MKWNYIIKMALMDAFLTDKTWHYQWLQSFGGVKLQYL